MTGLKIAVIGGASSYTPELFADLADFRRELEVERVTLMDPNAEKVSFVADVGRRLLQSLALPTEIRTTQDVAEAARGADFIIMQIRVGGLQARMRDETLPMEFGLVGNETTGAGGFVCGLRTVTAALRIAAEIERVAPQAWLLNLSNPAGIVTEALLKHTRMRAMGFCNIPINTTYELADLFGVPPDELELRSFGLNHLSWARQALVGGQDRLQPLIAATRDQDSVLYQHGLVEDLIEPDWLRIVGMVPSWYVRYFYCTEQVIQQDRDGSGVKSRSDMQAEQELHDLYVTEGYTEKARHILASKGGAQYYLPVLQVISAMVNDTERVVIVDTQNGETLSDLPSDVCVEVPARIGRDRVEPVGVGRMPLTVRSLVQTVKAYEELTVEAAAMGSHSAALAALATHPLVGSYPRARQFWARVLENERAYIPAFYS